MKRVIHWYDYITYNIYFLGLSTISQTLSPLVFPLLVQQFMGEEAKASFFGTLRLWTLMVALLAQAFWGILSDHTQSRWGRRRPYIVGGTIVNLIFIGAIAFSSTLSGWTGFYVLFAMAILLQISSNAAQAAQQGIIPDLVPEDKRGRFSSLKAIFEVPLPLILAALAIAPMIKAGNYIAGIGIAVAVLVGSMLLTLLVHEDRGGQNLPPLDWAPFARLGLMAALFTVIILALGEAIKYLIVLLNGISDPAVLLIALGLAGLVAMAIAIALGVWMSVRISIGQAARQNPSFTWWVINRLAFLAAVVNISTFVVFFVQGRLGLVGQAAAGPATYLQLVVGIMILIMALVSGWLSDRIGHKRVVAIAGFIAALGTIVALSVPNLNVIYVGGVLIGAGTGMFYTANWALGTDLVPKGEAGRYLGISNLAGAGAGAVGAYIGGPIADYITVRVPNLAPIGPGTGYVLLFGIFATLFIGSVIALTRVQTPAPVPAAVQPTPDLTPESGSV